MAQEPQDEIPEEHWLGYVYGTAMLLLIAPVKTAFHLRFGRMHWTFELYREFPLNWLLLN